MARAVQVARADPEGARVAPAGARAGLGVARVVPTAVQVAPEGDRAGLEVARVVPAGTNDPALGTGGIKN